MAFQLFAAAGPRILKGRASAAMWTTDGGRFTYPDPLQGALLRVKVKCAREMQQLYPMSVPPPPSPRLPGSPLSTPPGDVDQIQYLIPAVLS